jgi:23S rRNA (uridine2552-2'-O)-methyltransferase
MNWLRRQAQDPYVKLATIEGFASRAAYKLEEINEKYHLLKPSSTFNIIKKLIYQGTVLDLGCAPGSWSQVDYNLKLIIFIR